MSTFANLAAAFCTVVFLIVLSVNVWQAMNGVNMPWSLAVARLMILSFLLLAVAVLFMLKAQP